MNTKKDYQLNYLSEKFYEKYNSMDYPEIENKENRPYMVMLTYSEKRLCKGVSYVVSLRKDIGITVYNN